MNNFIRKEKPSASSIINREAKGNMEWNMEVLGRLTSQSPLNLNPQLTCRLV
jgi:hypothetical protein